MKKMRITIKDAKSIKRRGFVSEDRFGNKKWEIDAFYRLKGVSISETSILGYAEWDGLLTEYEVEISSTAYNILFG